MFLLSSGLPQLFCLRQSELLNTLWTLCYISNMCPCIRSLRAKFLLQVPSPLKKTTPWGDPVTQDPIFGFDNEEIYWIWALVAGSLDKGTDTAMYLQIISSFPCLWHWDLDYSHADSTASWKPYWKLKHKISGFVVGLAKRNISHKDMCFWRRMAANSLFCTQSPFAAQPSPARLCTQLAAVDL